jgi:hypothetical protein
MMGEAALANLPLEALKAAGMVAWEFNPETQRVRFSENASEIFGLAEGVCSLDVNQGMWRTIIKS